MVTHEIGQWCAYPDFNQISKYIGVLKPYNYELFREDLRNKKMLDQAHDFHIASGKFQVLQKKEEFEKGVFKGRNQIYQISSKKSQNLIDKNYPDWNKKIE